jgi:hypothetical protein
MPIVAEHREPKWSQAPLWVLRVALIALLPVSVFAWSCANPITMNIGDRQFSMGPTRAAVTSTFRVCSQGNGWVWTVPFPLSIDEESPLSRQLPIAHKTRKS